MRSWREIAIALTMLDQVTSWIVGKQQVIGKPKIRIETPQT